MTRQTSRIERLISIHDGRCVDYHLEVTLKLVHGPFGIGAIRVTQPSTGEKMYHSLAGAWTAITADGSTHVINLPGTLDTNRIGQPDAIASSWHPAANIGNPDDRFDPQETIETRFTRKFTFEGPVRIERTIEYCSQGGNRVFIEVQRARHLTLTVDGEEVLPVNTPNVSTPYIFEVPGGLSGQHLVSFISDNSYPGWPREAIVGSSAATDETQTNWNGLIGDIRIREELPVFISSLRVYPEESGLTVKGSVDAATDFSGEVILESKAIDGAIKVPVVVVAGTVAEFELAHLQVNPETARWDEGEGNLHELRATLSNGDWKRTRFGIRIFGQDQQGHLQLNGRRIFVRSEANCATFPETGHPPMDLPSWKRILTVFRSYGVNMMRFHSHCPPEAAFEAADELGMLMQPELSHWDPLSAFESDESYQYYRGELEEIILNLANHPSFVMLTFGNELCTGPLGHQRMDQLLSQAHQLDSTRLYANGSNVHYGLAGADPASDFYTTATYVDPELDLADIAIHDDQGVTMAQATREYPIRATFARTDGQSGERIEGFINNDYPSAQHNYDRAVEKIREKYHGPIFSFEVGQFEVLPDFAEITAFEGVTIPTNFQAVERRMKKRGLQERWETYVNASGELSLLCYREEVEAALRTSGLSGISLLGLQDFPGQGTALVGMLNSHLEPKPYPFAAPQRFAAFFSGQLPLVLLPKYTYTNGEQLTAEIKVANYGHTDITGRMRYRLHGGKYDFSGSGPQVTAHRGQLNTAGEISLNLKGIKEAVRLDLEVAVGHVRNSYPIWVYPDQDPIKPESILEARHFDDEVVSHLSAGGTVYLSPTVGAESLPGSVQTQFSTDFWSVRTFPKQDGAMGQYIDNSHPIFDHFPTEEHSNWQWWPMAIQRAVVIPESVQAIIAEMDSYAFLRPMAKLFECKVGKGKLLFSSMGLQDLQCYPEGRALQTSIYRYLSSDAFEPEQEVSAEVIRGLVC